MHCKCENYQDDETDREIDCLDWVSAFKSLPIGTICMIQPHDISNINDSVISRFLNTTSQVVEKIDEVSTMFSNYTSLRAGNRCIKRRISFNNINAGNVGVLIFYKWCDKIVTSPEDAVNGGYSDREFEVTQLSDVL